MGASMSVSGVRNSWLTLLKNVVFARSISAKASAPAPQKAGLRLPLEFLAQRHERFERARGLRPHPEGF